MINLMFSLLVNKNLLFLYFLFFTIQGISAELNIKLNKLDVEMGKYLSAEIIYTGNNKPDLSKLYKWEENFFIDRLDTEVDKLANGSIQSTEKLRLYPRKIGNVVLDSIALGGAISKPVSISIRPAIRNTIDATPQWQAMPTTMWQGQTIKLEVTLNLLHPSNHISVDEAIFSGFDVTRLPNKIRAIGNNKIIGLAWQLTALTKGVYQLELPAIEQKGHGRWHFYLARKTIKVKPLPSYLPPTIAIGEVSIETKLDGDSWQITIKNKGQLLNDIYGLRTQLAKISATAIDSISHSKKIDPINPQINIQSYSIPIPDWSWGFGKGPKLSIDYFDIKEGRLKNINTLLQSSWKFPLFFNFLLVLLLGLLITMLLFFLLEIVKKSQNKYKYIQAVKSAKDVHQLRKIILRQEQCISLEAWANKTKRLPAHHIAKQLNQLCYSNTCKLSFKKTSLKLISFLQ